LKYEWQLVQDLFKAVHIFNSRLLVVSRLRHLQILNAASEWQIYLDLAIKRAVVTPFGTQRRTAVKTFIICQ